MAESKVSNILEATIEEIHLAYKGEATYLPSASPDILDRIAAYDKQGPAINSIITINSNALRRGGASRQKIQSVGSGGTASRYPSNCEGSGRRQRLADDTRVGAV